ncbi:hypothetical protein, partial [Micromonospora sp. I033]
MDTDEEGWVPEACTLPTVERPLREAEFDDVLRGALCGQRRLSARRLRWEFTAAAEAAVRDLLARESRCCGFFTFTVTPLAGAVRVDVTVP